MSMNIHFVAVREIIIAKSGKKSTQEIYFDDVIQTPTKVTYEIHGSKDPIQSYKDWVMQNSKDEKYPIYADDDFLSERDPIGFEVYNFQKEHIARFQEWIDCMIEEGFVIKSEVL